MRYLAIFIISLFICSCGDYPTYPVPPPDAMPSGMDYMPAGAGETPQYWPNVWKFSGPRDTSLWQVTNACKDAKYPTYFMYWDLNSGEEWGPFESTEFMDVRLLKLVCGKMHTICWGAWKGFGPYYDGSKGGGLVQYNPAYYEWGGGRYGARCAWQPEWYKPFCLSTKLSKMFLNCGS